MLESLSCLLSNPSGIFPFGAHFPLQIFILPRLLLVCQNKGSEAIFECILPFWWPISSPNFLLPVPVILILHAESKNANHFSFGASNLTRRAGGAARIEKKPVFVPKICHVTKIFPNSLKLGLEVLYEVLCCAKEASTNIQIRSCSFASFASFVALLNLAFKLLIRAFALLFHDL